LTKITFIKDIANTASVENAFSPRKNILQHFCMDTFTDYLITKWWKGCTWYDYHQARNQLGTSGGRSFL